MPLTSYSCYSYDPKECSNDTIIYIPHGRDNISRTQDTSHTYYVSICTHTCTCHYSLVLFKYCYIPINSWVDCIYALVSSPNLFWWLMNALGPGCSWPADRGSSSWWETMDYNNERRTLLFCKMNVQVTKLKESIINL